MPYRLLLVSNDKPWSNSAGEASGTDGSMVERVTTAAEAMSRVLESRCDLALIDIDLGSMEGLRWLETLRQTDAGRNLPVIVASRRRSDEDLGRAFELGADDYVLKTCEPLELAARVRSALRRRYERAARAEAAITVGAISVDPSRHECRVRGKLVALNPREFELLEILLRKAGRVLSRAYLLETVWQMDRFSNTRTVDVAVSRLRKALGPRAAKAIETVDRYGYRLKARAGLER